MLWRAFAVATGVAAAGGAICWLYLRGRRYRTHEEGAAARDARLTRALQPADGLTVYWAGESPCARRVLVTLREKGLPYRSCVISLLHGEQRHPSFLAINPQGKVPVLVVRGVPGVEDAVIYESAAIVLFLDEAFPDAAPRLLPEGRRARLEARLWQYWELCAAEEFWPLSRVQVDGVLWRWGYSKEEWEAASKLMSGGDASRAWFEPMPPHQRSSHGSTPPAPSGLLRSQDRLDFSWRLPERSEHAPPPARHRAWARNAREGAR